MSVADGVPNRRYEFGSGVVDVLRGCDTTRIVLSGDLDLSTVARVRVAIESACVRAPANVVVDLSAVEFVDSHGLQLLVTTHRNVTAEECSLAVVPPSGHVRRAFTLTGLDWLFGGEPAADTMVGGG